MKEKAEYINPKLCPLCNENNHCGNISSCDSGQRCWCREQVIQFPDTLLKLIPDAAKNKACLCKTCALTMID